MDWLLFGFGHGGHKVLPKEPSGAEGASDRLYQVFNIETLLAYPHDYFGDILCENQHGQRSGFFPTPMSVVEMLVLMTVDGDARLKTVCDPCVGTGRMLLVASNYSLRLYGVDIDPTVIKATLVNGYLFAPWLVKPFPFLDGANLDPTQTIAISNALASHKPDYHQETVPSPNGQEYAPIKEAHSRIKGEEVEEQDWLTCFLPPNTAFRFSSALMSVLFFASCNPFLRMYAHNFLVSSVRGSGIRQQLWPINRPVAPVS